MRIALYGMPSAGKTRLLDRIDFFEVMEGGRLLREIAADFDVRDSFGRDQARRALAGKMMKRDNFIMDGHYAFGEEMAFSDEDGKLFDVFLYLYISPEKLEERMKSSEKNRRYLSFDIEKWQMREVEGLRDYCHRNDKDFYVLDNPPQNIFENIEDALAFIRVIVEGYSCLFFAKSCAADILHMCDTDTIVLMDGDKTLCLEDSSSKVFGYKTHLFDGNFYTGYQAWRQSGEFEKYAFPDCEEMPVHLNESVRSAITNDTYILTSGHEKVWGYMANNLGLRCYCGPEMSAETKYFITKTLQAAGKRVIAYGDGMNDYYMLKQADRGYLVAREDGSISRSLSGRDMEGLIIV